MSQPASSPPSAPFVSGAEVRRRFVTFFTERGHKEVPSSSLVPHNDPTVLLTTAGMQQMTPYFLGLETPPASRMVTVQKCFRTVDIEEVGDDSHCTFFFMLGNFSVGDYFKRESLAWSWEFFTKTMGLPSERLYPSVHPDDEVAYAIWRDEIRVPEDRIAKLPDNWWGPVGPTGPNGPDSEIYFDLGPEFDDGSGTGPGDNPRYLEVWNNVFMEFLQAEDGSRTRLPRQHVDTGMGFERLVMVMQGARSVYDTDVYQPIIQHAAGLSGVTYGRDATADAALRVIADHARGATFLIGDGVLPGNEGRAYVLRRLLRRAVRHGRQLGLTKPFLAEMAGIVIAQFGAEYPNLRERQRQIDRVLHHEEESFGRTLTSGMARLQTLVEGIKETAANSDREATTLTLPGEEAFKLYDTYGFPLDLTADLVREQGITVDQAGFDAAMATQRQTSRGGEDFKDTTRGRAELYVSVGGGTTEFLGYEATEADATVLALLGTDGALDEAVAGQAVEVVLDRTPFYGESGGQVGDTGQIRTETGLIAIEDTRKPTPDMVVHRGTVAEGFVRAGEPARAEVDAARRQAIRRNHTATHLLHRALRLVLGEEAHQAGSLVAPDRLRFDFTAMEATSPDHLRRVAEIVNHEIAADTPVETAVRSQQDAIAGGAMALFGEKYGDRVRVVSIGDFSMELCGGTHVAHTGEIGPFLVVSEGSVAAGVRRMEALTGGAAIERMLTVQRTVEEAAREMRVPWTEVGSQLSAIQDRARGLEREIERLRGQLAGARASDLLDRAEAVDGTRVLAARVDADSKDGLRQLGDRLKDRLDSGVIVLGSVIEGRPSLLSMVTPDLIARGVRAGDVVREAAIVIEGRGGGRPDLAEAGGKNPNRLDEALAAVPAIVRRGLGG
ncbi:MAG: Alanyl-tRNA synthetase [uncultured Thermomicrobiales bacterium]|uniref:Alanine--tRNA ligase n=1 Tax=uncultured Thermomicrobiales bacterium TaxID=1645740 RepID=A0A6J4UXI6_9BACT|nr:MAG: Alanyl-tRNA synthetase [uncultured Thermomicrobiales bacterium]